MYKLAKPLFLICETPLHAGSGDSLGIVDLPIQRERHTGFPKIEASSLKGAIRESFEENENVINVFDSQETTVNEKMNIHLTFGPEETGDAGHAGALGFSDARILLFPMKSMKGVFAYITCPAVLKRFKKELEDVCKLGSNKDFLKIENFDNYKDTVSNKEHLCLNNHVVLEEYAIKIEKEDNTIAKYLAEVTRKSEINDKLVILPDNVFTDFVQLSTEVITRTKINNETGTVQSGALFTEEFLPAESVLYSLVMASPIFQPENKKDKAIFYKRTKAEKEIPEEESVMEFFQKGLKPIIQIGGNATLGKGIVKTVVGGKENE
ncbi:MAG: type III-B CRISPR module RAMP protein Cmr4 [Leptospiraceae bacterium]|nr:type III-B CRISPR module RAMP protein Cmr4 [Leptospiraceae bacterium]